MGQYYKPVLIGPRDGVKWLYSHEYSHNGMKLMEHSYMGNSFVNAVLSQILHHPMRVAWMGDYADEPWSGLEPYQEKMDKYAFLKLYEMIWPCEGAADKKKKIHPEPLSMFTGVSDFTGWYLVNHTQRVYINLKTYAERNKWREHYKDWRTGETEEWDMCIHPLPLLTACGNNRGGGDYYDSHPGFDQIGTWAFDKIEFTAFEPEGYKEVSYRFTEQETVKQ